MDRPDTIQLLLNRHEIEASRASGLLPPAGRVVVEMLPESSRFGVLFLPEAATGRMRPDVGIVLAAGPDVSLAPGAMVCVRGYDGNWLEGFDAGYRTSNQVRVYGCAQRFVGEVFPCSWSDSIPLQIVGEGEEFEMVATGHNVIVRRDPLVERESVLWLKSEDQYRNGKATVVSVGPDCDLDVGDRSVAPGDRIVYNVAGELDFSFGADPDLAIVTDAAVYCLFADQA